MKQPFAKQNVRRDALRELKRAIVKLGASGDRKSLELVRRLFRDIPGLKDA